jgi:hypothetical protein
LRKIAFPKEGLFAAIADWTVQVVIILTASAAISPMTTIMAVLAATIYLQRQFRNTSVRHNIFLLQSPNEPILLV